MRLTAKGRRVLVGLLATPLVLGGLTALPALAATSGGGTRPAATSGSSRTAHTRLYTLPTGDHVRVTGTGTAARTHLIPAPGHSGTAVTSNVGGRLTVVPVSAFRTLSSLSDFQVEGPPQPVHEYFSMSLLTVKAIDHAGKPAAIAEVVVVNVDDPETGRLGRHPVQW